MVDPQGVAARQNRDMKFGGAILAATIGAAILAASAAAVIAIANIPAEPSGIITDFTPSTANAIGKTPTSSPSPAPSTRQINRVISW
jgi:hypothetical protein